MSQSQAEQLAREIAREASFLSERWRLWLVNHLADEAAGFDPEQQQKMILNQRMREAVQALQRVAQHLELSEAEALTDLTMSQFDAAPESVREGWRARRIADLIRGSWGVAKQTAFTDAILPVKADLELKRDKGLTRKRREGAFVLAGIQQWLESKPKDKQRVTYDRWAVEQNQQLPEGQKPFLRAKSIHRRWPMPWAEVVKAVIAGRVPGEEDEQLAVRLSPDAQPELVDANAPRSAASSSEPERINLDFQIDRERLRKAREAKELGIMHLSRLADLEQSNLSKIEHGEITNPSFQTVAKLAAVLDLSLDELIVPGS